MSSASGKYLTEAADCEVCHTTEGGQPVRRRARRSRRPLVCSTRRTSPADRETGIGAWTDADFIRAVHKGIGKDGHAALSGASLRSRTHCSPTMMFCAIKAYLFSLPVAHAAHRPTI